MFIVSVNTQLSKFCVLSTGCSWGPLGRRRFHCRGPTERAACTAVTSPPRGLAHGSNLITMVCSSVLSLCPLGQLACTLLAFSMRRERESKALFLERGPLLIMCLDCLFALKTSTFLNEAGLHTGSQPFLSLLPERLWCVDVAT